MKILGVADIHVHNYSLYSTFNENGVPSRLSDFELLASEIVHQATIHEVNVIVIAGDLLQSSSPQPMVLNMAKTFLSVVADSGLPVILIIGQHDLDNKNDTNNLIHSVVTPILPDYPNLFYVFDRNLIVLNDGEEDYSFFCKSWTTNQSDISSFEDADVFIGHGLVSGAKDPFGHVFDNGFSAPQLLEKYKVSIIGDIHCPSTWFDKARNRVVSIPAQPIQSNFSSADPGMVVIGLDKEIATSFHRIEFKDYLRADKFHYFRFVHDEGQKDSGSERDHVRFKALEKKSKTVASEKATAEIAPKGFNVLEMLAKHLVGSEYEVAMSVLKTAYEKVKHRDIKVAAPSQLLGIEIERFLSIESLKLDFSKLTGRLLIAGPNGTGKTTIPEAVYWLLTGETTKGIPKDKLNFDFSKLPARVVGRININGAVWRVERQNKDPILRFYQDGKKDTATKSSVAQTQKQIYAALGVDQEDILSLMYYSIHDSKTYTARTRAEKQDFLSKISGKEVVEFLSEAFDAEVAELQEEVSKKSGAFNANASTLATYTREMLATAELGRAAKLTRKRSDVQREIDEAETKKVDESKYTAAIEGYSLAASKAENCSNRLVTLKERVNRIDAEIARERQLIEEVKGGKCPACGGPLKDIAAHAKKHEQEIAELTVSRRVQQEQVDLEQGQLDKAVTARLKADEKVQEEKAGIVANNALSVGIAALKREMSALPEEKDYLAAIRQLKTLSVELEATNAALGRELEGKAALLGACRKVKTQYLSRDSVITRELSYRAIKLLEREINDLVQDSNLYHIEMGEDPDDIEVKFMENTYPISVSGMSGGQRRATDVLILVACNNLCNRLYGLEAGILGLNFLDEIFAYLDPRYTDIVMYCVENLSTRLTVIITQDAAIRGMIDQAIIVSKKAGEGSKYKFVNVER